MLVAFPKTLKHLRCVSLLVELDTSPIFGYYMRHPSRGKALQPDGYEEEEEEVIIPPGSDFEIFESTATP